MKEPVLLARWFRTARLRYSNTGRFCSRKVWTAVSSQFRKSAPVLALISKTAFAPTTRRGVNSAPQEVIRSVRHPPRLRTSTEGFVVFEQPFAKHRRDFLSGPSRPPLQRSMQRHTQRRQPRLQFRSLDPLCFPFVPHFKKLFHCPQSRQSRFAWLAAQLLELLKIALQMRPTQLAATAPRRLSL